MRVMCHCMFLHLIKTQKTKLKLKKLQKVKRKGNKRNPFLLKKQKLEKQKLEKQKLEKQKLEKDLKLKIIYFFTVMPRKQVQQNLKL